MSLKKYRTRKNPGANGYIAFYKGKQIEIYADTKYQAQLDAQKIFKAKKSYDVDVELAELGGKPVIHKTSELNPRRNPPEMQIKFKTPWRNFKYRYEVPEKVMKSQFDHLSEDDSDTIGYFKFRGYWYHLSDFICTSIPGWDGIAIDSYFSGILLKISRDGEQYQAALALS